MIVLVIKLLNLFVFKRISWKMISNWFFQRNVDSMDVECGVHVVMMLIISTSWDREDTSSPPADGGRQAVRRIIDPITQIGHITPLGPITQIGHITSTWSKDLMVYWARGTGRRKKNIPYHHKERLFESLTFCLVTPSIKKLDGVGPVDNRPSTNKLHHLKKKKIHVTLDMWHVTRDMWHVTHDTFVGVIFSQNFSSLALTVCDLWYYEDLEEKDDWLCEWINCP